MEKLNKSRFALIEWVNGHKERFHRDNALHLLTVTLASCFRLKFAINWTFQHLCFVRPYTEELVLTTLVYAFTPVINSIHLGGPTFKKITRKFLTCKKLFCAILNKSDHCASPGNPRAQKCLGIDLHFKSFLRQHHQWFH